MGVDAEMLVKTKKQYTEDQIRMLAYDLAEAFGYNRFFIHPPGQFSWTSHALELVGQCRQDELPVEPQDDDQFIRVNLAGRYYGKGYERGDPYLYIAVAQWLEYRIDDAEIWYGSDSSGLDPEPFTASRRRELMYHFCKVGHKPYHGHFEKGNPTPPTCDFCKGPTYIYSWGPGNAKGYYCPGCNQKFQTVDNGETFQLIEEKPLP